MSGKPSPSLAAALAALDAGQPLTPEHDEVVRVHALAVGRSLQTDSAKRGLGAREEHLRQVWARTKGLEAKRKQKSGEPVTDEEAEALRAYYREWRKQRSFTVYFADAEERAEVEALARADGATNLSQWIIQKAKEAAKGSFVDPGYIQVLQARAAELEAREEQAHARAEEYRQRKDALELKVERLLDDYASLNQKLATLLEQFSEA